MTTNDPDRIRDEIEHTQASLSNDVDALADKVSPSRVAERQTDRVKGAVSGAKDMVFGAADEAKDRVSGTGDSVRGTIAFGAGLLAASLLPSSRKEREVVQQTKESQSVQEATQEAKGTAQEMADHLREPARDAAQQVRSTATEGAQEVKDTATSGAQEVRGEAQHAAQDVKGQAQESTDQVRDSRG